MTIRHLETGYLTLTDARDLCKVNDVKTSTGYLTFYKEYNNGYPSTVKKLPSDPYRLYEGITTWPEFFETEK